MLLFYNILRLHTTQEIETMPDQSRKPSTANDTESLLTPKDLAGRLKLTVETLCRWRARGVGPDTIDSTAQSATRSEMLMPGWPPNRMRDAHVPRPSTTTRSRVFHMFRNSQSPATKSQLVMSVTSSCDTAGRTPNFHDPRPARIT